MCLRGQREYLRNNVVRCAADQAQAQLESSCVVLGDGEVGGHAALRVPGMGSGDGWWLWRRQSRNRQATAAGRPRAVDGGR